ncbi:MAG: hypothetical protein CVU48_04940 [Candidatus Cloacimonetes bacterium HGW-Cloacimonetes-1]|jgi:uncharacterized membrane protein|nr:MAG: hypothetical protein CVU48_04940 [Candidatus Cloacimonetes bacterium HGW-Cloacimonetes-1]
MISTLTSSMNTYTLAWVMGIIFITLNVLDAHSTWLVIRPNNYSGERNPIARWVFRKLGIPRGIVIFKCVLLAILIPCVIYYAVYDVFTINIVLVVADLLFLWVVYHNYKHYRQRVEFECSLTRGMK